MTIALLVKRKRAALGITQREAGERCGLTAMTISNIERGAGGILLTTAVQLIDGLCLDAWEVIRHARG